MPTFVPVSDEILDDRNGRSTQKKSIGNKYDILFIKNLSLLRSVF